MLKTYYDKICKQNLFGWSILFAVLLMSFATLTGCKSDDVNVIASDGDGEEIPQDSVVVLDSASVDTEMIYKPQELANMNFYKSTSTWYYGRSQQSDHFVVFWDKKYGANHPNSDSIPTTMRVDIDDLLEKAEEFYDLNINHLKFAETGVGKSNLDQYKMMIFIFYQDEWLATGSGYDDTIGALWINPATMHPVGSTIGHEIGHSFQYQVFCDLGESTGFRYGFGGNGGNSFWEQTAQWQSYQSYPEEAFSSYNFPVYMENYHRHILHEWQRYASYFIHYYWADKHGVDIVGKVWRSSKQPEDPIQTYMRITGISNDEFNAELYDMATKMVTWDLDNIRETGKDYIGQHTYGFTSLSDGSFQVAYDHCPGTSGYNVIPLNVPAAGTVVSTKFTGLFDAAGFNPITELQRAGWRYGYVALLEDGTRVYGDMNKKSSADVEFTVPASTKNLWFVVAATPLTYAAHPWDEEESNDDQWPYKVKFTNTNLLGTVVFDGTESQEDVTLTYDVSFPVDAAAYTGEVVSLGAGLTDLAYAFVLQPTDITAKLDTEIKFYAVDANGSLDETRTANGYGQWFDADGNVIGWGETAMVFSEFDAANFAFSIGQYPAHSSPGDQYTIKQALVYEYAPGQTVQATFVFNITLE